MPSDPRDYKVELSGATRGDEESTPAVPARPFIGVKFACCDVYTRIYRTADGQRYDGRCPRCGKPVHFAVGAGGTDARTFIVE
jgi:hypothetical protein